ncbi:hypothetical protein NEDG_00185 [Nematocida displodere]|uniref:U3 small nucleolar RNA-associated protein 10 n=1 Tax=Nematocida displodere TaxID=1805483 RepID=A0A177EK10_9MICR|nr:hypothetical protein NEDG_00185 [Nematocida displodere]
MKKNFSRTRPAFTALMGLSSTKTALSSRQIASEGLSAIFPSRVSSDLLLSLLSSVRYDGVDDPVAHLKRLLVLVAGKCSPAKMKRFAKHSPELTLAISLALLDKDTAIWHSALVRAIRYTVVRQASGLVYPADAILRSISALESGETPSVPALLETLPGVYSEVLLVEGVDSLYKANIPVKNLAKMVSILSTRKTEGEVELSDVFVAYILESAPLLLVRSTHELLKVHGLSPLYPLLQRISGTLPSLLASSAPKTRGYILHLLETLFRHYLKDTPTNAAADHGFDVSGASSLLFSLFSKTRDLKVLKSLSFAIPKLPEPQKSFYKKAAFECVGAVLGSASLNFSGTDKIIAILGNIVIFEEASIVLPHVEKLCRQILPEHTRPLTMLLQHIAPHPPATLFLIGEIEKGSCAASAALGALIASKTPISEDVLSPFVFALRKALHRKTPSLLTSLGELLSLLPNTRKALVVDEVLQWCCAALGESEYLEFCCSGLSASATHSNNLTLLNTAFVLVSEEAERPSLRPHLFTALKDIHTRILSLTKNVSTHFQDTFCRLAAWIDASPTPSLPALYALALAFFLSSPNSSEWINVGCAVVDRLPAYCKDKAVAEGVLLGAIVKGDKLMKVLRRMVLSIATAHQKTRPLLLKALEGIALASFDTSTPFLVSLYEKDSVALRAFVLRYLLSSIARCTKAGVSSRNMLPLILPVISHATTAPSPELRVLGCKVSGCVVVSCWGTPSDFATAVHLLNGLVPLLVDKKAQDAVVEVLPLFSQRLSLDFLSAYLVNGLYHRSRDVRSAYRKAYKKVSYREAGISTKAQEVPLFLFSAK